MFTLEKKILKAITARQMRRATHWFHNLVINLSRRECSDACFELLKDFLLINRMISRRGLWNEFADNIHEHEGKTEDKDPEVQIFIIDNFRPRHEYGVFSCKCGERMHDWKPYEGNPDNILKTLQYQVKSHVVGRSYIAQAIAVAYSELQNPQDLCEQHREKTTKVNILQFYRLFFCWPNVEFGKKVCHLPLDKSNKGPLPHIQNICEDCDDWRTWKHMRTIGAKRFSQAIQRKMNETLRLKIQKNQTAEQQTETINKLNQQIISLQNAKKKLSLKMERKNKDNIMKSRQIEKLKLQLMRRN